MRSFLAILCCLFLIVGANMLPVQSGENVNVPVMAAIVQPPAVAPTHNEPVQPGNAHDQLAALLRPAAAGSVCPLFAVRKIEKQKQVIVVTGTTATVEREGVVQHPLRAVASAGGKIVRVVIGHQRRAERRAER